MQPTARTVSPWHSLWMWILFQQTSCSPAAPTGPSLRLKAWVVCPAGWHDLMSQAGRHPSCSVHPVHDAPSSVAWSRSSCNHTTLSISVLCTENHKRNTTCRNDCLTMMGVEHQIFLIIRPPHRFLSPNNPCKIFWINEFLNRRFTEHEHLLKCIIIWVIMLCSLVEAHWHFQGRNHLQPQDQAVSQARNQQ